MEKILSISSKGYQGGKHTKKVTCQRDRKIGCGIIKKKLSFEVRDWLIIKIPQLQFSSSLNCLKGEGLGGDPSRYCLQDPEQKLCDRHGSSSAHQGIQGSVSAFVSCYCLFMNLI